MTDRKYEYNENNMSLCEINCEYDRYNSNTKKAKCECEIKSNMSLISEIIINKDKLLNNFINIKNSSNIKIMKCFKELFDEDRLKRNIGNYILLSVIVGNLICLITFIIKGFKLLNIIIDKNIFKNNILNNTNINNKKEKQFAIRNNEINNIIIKHNNSPQKKKQKKIKKNDLININIIKTNEEIINNKSSSLVNMKNENWKINKQERIEDIYNDYEINTLTYKKALKNDKRTYIKYYFSLLRKKQILLFTFYINNDYNSKNIKICLFLFSFALYYAVNALFFNDSTMHKIYIDEDKYNFIYQIPNILYSILISSIIDKIIKYFSLTETYIIEIKNNKEKEKNINIKKRLIIKFIIFFILDFLFLILFWYYISCFCAIYKNTQFHLIKDTLIGFGLSLLYPFIFCLLPGVFRIPSLRASKQDKECLYKISIIIQDFC